MPPVLHWGPAAASYSTRRLPTYTVAIAWQGLVETQPPTIACGNNAYRIRVPSLRHLDDVQASDAAVKMRQLQFDRSVAQSAGGDVRALSSMPIAYLKNRASFD